VIDRGAFVARWEARAAEVEDPFDQFFCLWIALVIQARPELDPEQLDANDTDRTAVLRLSQAHADAIFTTLAEVSGELG
jgi:hypothetical protein